MLFLYIINLALSLMFIFLKHPLSMGCLLLIQTMMISLITGMMNFTFWFSYILFLVMIGGMLVLFIYMTSIASNEKFKFSNKLMIMFMIIMMFNILFLMDQFYFNLNLINYDTMMNNMHTNNSMSMNKYMNVPTNFIYLIIIFYLLITMIAVVKISESKAGPLRQKF